MGYSLQYAEEGYIQNLKICNEGDTTRFETSIALKKSWFIN